MFSRGEAVQGARGDPVGVRGWGKAGDSLPVRVHVEVWISEPSVG